MRNPGNRSCRSSRVGVRPGLCRPLPASLRAFTGGQQRPPEGKRGRKCSPAGRHTVTHLIRTAAASAGAGEAASGQKSPSPCFMEYEAYLLEPGPRPSRRHAACRTAVYKACPHPGPPGSRPQRPGQRTAGPGRDRARQQTAPTGPWPRPACSRSPQRAEQVPGHPGTQTRTDWQGRDALAGALFVTCRPRVPWRPHCPLLTKKCG